MDWNCWFSYTDQPSTFAPILAPALAAGLWTLCPSVPHFPRSGDYRTNSLDHSNASFFACSNQLSKSDLTPSESVIFSAFQARQTPARACSYSCLPFQHTVGHPSITLPLNMNLPSSHIHFYFGTCSGWEPVGHISAKYTPFSISGWVVKSQSWSLPLGCAYGSSGCLSAGF